MASDERVTTAEAVEGIRRFGGALRKILPSVADFAPVTVEHEGEYYLTTDGIGLALFAGGCEPNKDGGMWKAGGEGGEWVDDAPDLKIFCPLADPTKPVRIRLKLQAERINE